MDEQKKKEKIAFLGIGAMGSRMVSRLLAAGHPVSVYNRTRDRAGVVISQGADFQETPRKAAMDADIVFSMVRDDAASKHVWLHTKEGALASMSESALGVECSTVSPAWIRELADEALLARKKLIEAPVLGSRVPAENGTLVHLMAGDEALCRRAEPLLALMGKKALYLGKTAQGMAFKLAVNALLGIQVAAHAELLSMLERHGIEQNRSRELLAELPVTSDAARALTELMVKGDVAPQFPVELVEKDLRLASELAPGSVPIVAATQAVFQSALDRGLGPENLVAVRKLYGA